MNWLLVFVSTLVSRQLVSRVLKKWVMICDSLCLWLRTESDSCSGNRAFLLNRVSLCVLPLNWVSLQSRQWRKSAQTIHWLWERSPLSWGNCGAGVGPQDVWLSGSQLSAQHRLTIGRPVLWVWTLSCVVHCFGE